MYAAENIRINFDTDPSGAIAAISGPPHRYPRLASFVVFSLYTRIFYHIGYIMANSGKLYLLPEAVTGDTVQILFHSACHWGIISISILSG